MASLRSLAISIPRPDGHANIAAASRRHARDPQRTLKLHEYDFAGSRRITVHGTRKTCGTLLAALDVRPRVAMQILRHSRISVTMEIYTEATSAATRAALKKLGDSLGSSAR
jgi:integrase